MSEFKKFKSRGGKDYSPGHRRMYWAACKLLEKKPSHILDVGSGMGYGYKWLERHGAIETYTGVEPEHEAVTYCRSQYPDATWIEGVVPGVQFLNPFDHVFCIEVLEHVESEQGVDPVAFIHELASLAKQNVFLSTPNRETSGHGVYSPTEVLGMAKEAGIANVSFVEQQWTTWYLLETSTFQSEATNND